MEHLRYRGYPAIHNLGPLLSCINKIKLLSIIPETKIWFSFCYRQLPIGTQHLISLPLSYQVPPSLPIGRLAFTDRLTWWRHLDCIISHWSHDRHIPIFIIYILVTIKFRLRASSYYHFSVSDCREWRMTGAHELAPSERTEGLHKKNAGLPEKEHIDEGYSMGAGS